MPARVRSARLGFVLRISSEQAIPSRAARARSSAPWILRAMAFSSSAVSRSSRSNDMNVSMVNSLRRTACFEDNEAGREGWGSFPSEGSKRLRWDWSATRSPIGLTPSRLEILAVYMMQACQSKGNLCSNRENCPNLDIRRGGRCRWKPVASSGNPGSRSDLPKNRSFVDHFS